MMGQAFMINNQNDPKMIIKAFDMAFVTEALLCFAYGQPQWRRSIQWHVGMILRTSGTLFITVYLR